MLSTVRQDSVALTLGCIRTCFGGRVPAAPLWDGVALQRHPHWCQQTLPRSTVLGTGQHSAGGWAELGVPEPFTCLARPGAPRRLAPVLCGFLTSPHGSSSGPPKQVVTETGNGSCLLLTALTGELSLYSLGQSNQGTHLIQKGRMWGGSVGQHLQWQSVCICP